MAGCRPAAPARASLPSGSGVGVFGDRGVFGDSGGGVFGDRGGGVFGGTGAPVSVIYVQRQAPSGIPSRRLRQPRKTTTSRYSVYLFFRYKSTNTDAGAGAMQDQRGKELGLFIPLPMGSANQHAAFEGSLSSLSSPKTKHVSLVAKASYNSSLRPHTLVA